MTLHGLSLVQGFVPLLFGIRTQDVPIWLSPDPMYPEDNGIVYCVPISHLEFPL